MSDNEKNLDTEAVETPVEEAPAEAAAAAFPEWLPRPTLPEIA